LKEPLRRDPQRATTLITGLDATASISLSLSLSLGVFAWKEGRGGTDDKMLLLDWMLLHLGDVKSCR